MRLLLTKSYNTVLIIITVPLTLSPLSLLLLVRLGDYNANLFAFYSYRLIGKLTVFLQLQEYHFRRAAFSSQLKSKPGRSHSRQGCSTTDYDEYRWVTYSFKITLTHHTLKTLTY